MLKYFSSILSFLRNFITKWCLMLKSAFPLYHLRWFCHFLSFVYLPVVLHLSICLCWTNFTPLKWNLLGHGYDLNVVLNSVCEYFIGNFCVYFQQRKLSFSFWVISLPPFRTKTMLTSRLTLVELFPVLAYGTVWEAL